jgi:hypothetical protein
MGRKPRSDPKQRAYGGVKLLRELKGLKNENWNYDIEFGFAAGPGRQCVCCLVFVGRRKYWW